MINFIVQVDFDGIKKHEELYFNPIYKKKDEYKSVQSFKDNAVQLKYISSREKIFIKNTNNKKLLALALINTQDREKLRQALNISDSSIKTNSELVLELYLKFGEEGFKKLPNGFIFILIDYKNKKVLSFRDHIGMKNICYYQKDSSIYLSSSFKNLFELSHLSHSLNKNKLINFLNLNDRSSTSTFTNEIKRIPPSHAIMFQKGIIKLYKYHNYGLNINLKSDKNYILGLKNILSDSVAANVASYGSKIGFLFSGGIDSTSIVSLFREQKDKRQEIYTFSCQFKNIDENIKHLIDESAFQNEMLKLADVKGFTFNGEDESTLSNLELYLEIIGQPFFFPNLYLTNRAFNLAYDNDVSLVMNGNDGDTVVSHGYEYFIELFISLQWKKLFIEIKKTSETRKQSKKFIFKQAVIKKLSYKSFTRNAAQKTHLEAMLSSNHSKAIEIQGLLGDYYGIEERYPFYNRDVIEYCLNVPARLKNKNGHSRYVLKQAIKEIVPEKIRLRTTKSNLGHALCLGYLKKDKDIIEEQLSRPNEIIKDIININDLKKSWKNLLQNPRKEATRSTTPSKIFSYTILNSWLNKHFKKNTKA